MLANTDFTGYEHTPDVVAYGDIHEAYVRTFERKTLLHFDSIGSPLDQPLACYAMLEGSGSESPGPLAITLVRLPYDIERAIWDAEQEGMPELAPYAKGLRTAQYQRRRQFSHDRWNRSCPRVLATSLRRKTMASFTMESRVRLYFAAPLFSMAERQFNVTLTARLEAAGFSVFLPQRDGAERDRPPYATMTREQRRAAMFALDTAEIFACDIFLIVLDGRVPDEGAAFELGVAYACKRLQQPAKRLIGLHTDARAAFIGAKLNPMLAVPLDALVTSEDALLESLIH